MESIESGCQQSNEPLENLKQPKKPLIDTEFVNYRYGLLRIAQAVVAVLWLVIVYARESTINEIAMDSCWLLSCSTYSGQSIRIMLIMLTLYSLSSILLFCFRLQEPLEYCINVPLTLCVFESIGAVFFALISILIIFINCYPLGLLLSITS
ncbi:uncharacterized protein LOC107362118 isoform X2 [Tetranychus urticae]|uniref:uncharacterized protein LOC107362118 isoform X2 n=1 Tax=Tetranychus urticae TaxID=32264 RepID=UPI00077B9B33|nr:uncharacterized protein LOC107362118 isoform X2 [Tetranychus urticae]